MVAAHGRSVARTWRSVPQAAQVDCCELRRWHAALVLTGRAALGPRLAALGFTRRACGSRRNRACGSRSSRRRRACGSRLCGGGVQEAAPSVASRCCRASWPAAQKQRPAWPPGGAGRRRRRPRSSAQRGLQEQVGAPAPGRRAPRRTRCRKRPVLNINKETQKKMQVAEPNTSWRVDRVTSRASRRATPVPNRLGEEATEKNDFPVKQR